MANEGRGFALPISFISSDLQIFDDNLKPGLTRNFEYITWFMNTYVPQLVEGVWDFGDNPIDSDIVSTSWNGANPPDLSGGVQDPVADAGFAIDSSAGAAQFNGDFFLHQSSTLYAGGVINVTGTVFSNNFLQGEDGFRLNVNNNGTAEFNGDVWIGGPDSLNAQVFITNTLQHINLVESDDAANGNVFAPNNVFILDVNGGIGRLLWLEDAQTSPAFTGIMTFGKDGTVNMNSASFRPTDGNAATPGIRRDATADGLFFGSGFIGFSIAGNEIARIDSDGLTNIAGTDALKLKAGASSDHVFMEFYADSSAQSTRSGYVGYPTAAGNDLFLTNEQSGTINFRTISTTRASIGSTGILAANGHVFFGDGGSSSAPLFTFSGELDCGLYLAGANSVGLAAGGVGGLTVQQTTLTSINIRDNTTASAASVFINATTGVLQRSTSALKYKSRVTTNVDYLADLEILPTKHWRKDDKKWRYGFIADWLASQDEMLGVYDDDGVVEDYDTRAVMAVQQAKINRLEKQVAELTNIVNTILPIVRGLNG